MLSNINLGNYLEVYIQVHSTIRTLRYNVYALQLSERDKV